MTQMVEDQSDENDDSEFGHFGRLHLTEDEYMDILEIAQPLTEALETSEKESAEITLWDEARGFLDSLKEAHEDLNLEKKLLTVDDMQGVDIKDQRYADVMFFYGAIQQQQFSGDPSATKLDIELPKCDDFFQEHIFDSIMRMNIAFTYRREVRKLMKNANEKKEKTMSYLIEHFEDIMTPEYQKIVGQYLNNHVGKGYLEDYQEEADREYKEEKRYIKSTTNCTKSFCAVLSLLAAENKKSFTFEEIEAKINFFDPN